MSELIRYSRQLTWTDGSSPFCSLSSVRTPRQAFFVAIAAIETANVAKYAQSRSLSGTIASGRPQGAILSADLSVLNFMDN
jgi:hypothetical protein